MDLRPDPVVDELRRITPWADVCGGTFAHWLPHPRSISRAERPLVFHCVQDQATRLCLRRLFEQAGQTHAVPGRLPSGSRDWPQGYTGSVSHKGTKIVVALAHADRLRGIGIDIERLTDLRHSQRLVPDETVPRRLDTEEEAIEFSAKEAVFKALHPLLGSLDMNDIFLMWEHNEGRLRMGSAIFDGVTVEVHSSSVVDCWVASSARVAL